MTQSEEHLTFFDEALFITLVTTGWRIGAVKVDLPDGDRSAIKSATVDGAFTFGFAIGSADIGIGSAGKDQTSTTSVGHFGQSIQLGNNNNQD